MFCQLILVKLNDFYPDNIFQRLPVFTNIQEYSAKIVKKDFFNEAAKEIRS